MRLHRLELSAFGPFAGRVVVDFDTLAADGLFLLHGETGAGKTTLLDAVAFALYGRVPGARGEAKRLRCDRADQATPTEIGLELTVGGRRLHITRRPEYQRPKSRGVGMTTEKSSVVLRWVGSGPAEQPTEGLRRAEEVGRVVGDLLGMSAEQFFQVVLLPQGDFARFLRADTAEREVLLEKLFDTGRFKSIEQYFAEERRRATSRAAVAAAEVDRELARVAEAAGIDSPPDDADRRWLGVLQDGLAERAVSAGVSAQDARGARDARRADQAAAAGRDAAIGKLLQLRRQEAALAAESDSQAGLVAALSAAERATAVMLADRAAAAAGAVEGAAEEAVRAAAEAVPAEFQPALGSAGTHELDRESGLFSLDEDGGAYVPEADGVVLRRAAASARERAGSLAVLMDAAADQRVELARLGELRVDLDAAGVELAAIDIDLAGVPAERARAAQQLATAQAALGRLPAAVTLVDGSAEILAAARSLTGLRIEVGEATAVAAAAIDAHQRAVDQRQALIERRIAGMAGELAAELLDGAPCAVCGSMSHPAPAALGADPVDAAAVAAARDGERASAAAREAAEARVATLSGAVAVAQTTARGTVEPDALAAWNAARAAHTADAAAARLLAGAQDAMDLLIVRADLLAEQRTAVLGRREALQAAITLLLTSTRGRADRLATAAAPFDSVAEHRDQLVGVASALDRWAAATEDRDRARAASRRSVRELDKAVADGGFADLDEARSAGRLDVPTTRAAVRDHAERAAAVATRLADPDLNVADPLDRPDLPAIAARAASAVAEAERTASAFDAARARCAQVAAAVARLDRAWLVHAPLADASARLSALADTIAGHGQNRRALSLRSYVLAAKLQQVAHAAGQRLHRMSGGRYTFEYTDEREARGKSGGLGLEILDAYSGCLRPVKTLSGGESFLASLALALGLADVVAAESGGRMLDTIFIDEGFGSLDSDSLDLVMATLDELRAGGRVVGLVSHVDELRQRIPTRLRVRKTPQGSTVDLAEA